MAASIERRQQATSGIRQGIREALATVKESPGLATVFAAAGGVLGWIGHPFFGAIVAFANVPLGDMTMRNRQIRAGGFDANYQKSFVSKLAGRSIAMIGGIALGAGLKALSDYQFTKM